MNFLELVRAWVDKEKEEEEEEQKKKEIIKKVEKEDNQIYLNVSFVNLDMTDER